MQRLKAVVWRRGRGYQTWFFDYITQSNQTFFTTPGWYHNSGKGRMYRLTIDHDYPQKPVWLGYKQKRKWVNAEGLYEVLLVRHPHFFIANKRFRGTRGRSTYRRHMTANLLLQESSAMVEANL